MYVDVVGHFAMDLVRMIHCKRYTYLLELLLFSFMCTVYRCICDP